MSALLIAGLALFAVSVVWHANLAVSSTRAAARLLARGAAAAQAASSAAPHVQWLVLIDPSPAVLAMARAVRLRPRCRTRVVVVASDPSRHESPAYPEAHCLVVPPGLDRSEILNRAFRLVRRWCHRHGEDPARTVIGILAEGARPDEGLAVAVWRSFADPAVGAVQARVTTVGTGPIGAAQQYEDGVLADAANIRRGQRGAAYLADTGAFIRLSTLARLGPRPWRRGAATGRDLGLRVRQLGVEVRHDPRVRVVVGAIGRRNVLRGRARALCGQLQPLPGRSSWRDRASWALRVGGYPVPGVVAVWAVSAFAVTAWRLATGDPVVARWSVALGLGTDLRSWSVLAAAAAVWVGALVGPAAIWWTARPDLTAGRLLRGALAQPLLLLLRPAALGIVLVRSVGGRRAWASSVVSVPPTVEALGNSALFPGRSVFVDVTGRRRRRVWMVTNCAALAGMTYIMIVGYALGSAPVSPRWDASDPNQQHYPLPIPPAEPEPDGQPAPPPDYDADAMPANVSGSRGPAPRVTPMRIRSPMPAPSPSPSSPAPSVTTSPSPSPSVTMSPSPSSSPSPSPSPSVTPSPSPTVTPSPSPTVTMSPSPSPSVTMTPSPSSSVAPSPSPSPSPSATPSPSVTPSRPPSPSRSPSPSPSASPSSCTPSPTSSVSRSPAPPRSDPDPLAASAGLTVLLALLGGFAAAVRGGE